MAEVFPRPLVTSLVALLFVANTINIGADLAAMGQAAQLVSGVNSHLWTIGFALVSPLEAFDLFEKTYAAKYEKAAACLAKDRDVLLQFYEFPAEHWKHLRTTNPIESTFATVRHRTIRTKGCMSNATAIAMVFKLIEAAQRSWRRLDGTHFLQKVIYGVKFRNGIEEEATTLHPQAEVAAA